MVYLVVPAQRSAPGAGGRTGGGGENARWDPPRWPRPPLYRRGLSWELPGVLDFRYMVDMTRRQFLASMAAAAVVAAAPSYVVPAEVELPEVDPEVDLLGSYDGGATHFKLRGNIKARARGDKVEFIGWLKVPKHGLAGRRLSVQHPETQIWLDIA